MPLPKTRRLLDFEAMIKSGENDLGFTAQTVNGTGHAWGTGFNKSWDVSRPQLPPDATRPAGRSNRTAE